MFIHKRYVTIATIVSALLTVIGTAAALVYYLYLTPYNTSLNFSILLGGYMFMVSATVYDVNRRLKRV